MNVGLVQTKFDSFIILLKTGAILYLVIVIYIYIYI